jgi:hypothetical protein
MEEMKTEGLTYKEALQALLDGHRIASSGGDYTYWFEGDALNSVNNRHGHHRTGIMASHPIVDEQPFSIVPPPPPKSLTFEEAVKAQLVKVAVPLNSGPIICPRSPFTEWSTNQLALFDLAERRGWHMEVVE